MSGIYFWPWTLAAGLTNLRTENLVRVVVCKHYTLASTLWHWVFRFGVEAHSGAEHAISTAALYEGDALTGEAAYRSAPNESLKALSSSVARKLLAPVHPRQGLP